MGAERGSPSTTFLSSGRPGAPDQEAAEKCGEGLRVETLPGSHAFFQEEKATPAVLSFLREIQVGHFVTAATLGGGRGAEYPAEGQGGEGEPSPSRDEEGDEGGPSRFAEECGWGSEQEKPKNQLPP